ncbi:putative Pep2 [Bradyrhizobium sp. STM 3843]|uniref:LysR family transcriptional regulator n=1 Tax=Bradyrhizobium sp. STM 3843 TaxID=551947 RepID=UPI000240B08A|nr:LysR family transcriptional regulator [Bradyrhizobium sp. STM 3843]CCE07114.1 putative Pep2 [Bradyrhizobium sp. STM 3843]
MPPQDLDHRIGDWLRLRDLRIFRAVVESGSMAKAAGRLSITQPAVSQAIAQLEAALKVRLLDRGPRGVALTVYGEALMRRGTEAFDALRQGLRDIEFLANPGAGEVVVGASESHIAGGFLAEIIQSVARAHPQLAVRVVEANTAAVDFHELRDRKLDMMLGRIARDRPDMGEGGDFRADVLFDEEIHIVAGAQNEWVAVPTIDFADLVDHPWILAPEGTAVYELVRRAFQRRGLPEPKVNVTTYSMNLRLQLLMQGPYLTALPSSVVRFNAGRWALTTLPLSLGNPLPVAIVTLRHRTFSPAVRVFIDHARNVTKALRI